MSSIYGENIHISIFGQSHSAAIGVAIDGIPAGLAIDTDALNAFMRRRAPGQNEYSTARREADEPEFLSGIADGHTCGAPIAAIIRNTDTRSRDYDPFRFTPRPGHADYTADIKYRGFEDRAGGGHFSGRLTAPLCIAGGICIQLLQQQGISIMSRIASIGSVHDAGELIEPTADKPFPTVSSAAGEAMRREIAAAKAEGDSVGGTIECRITGLEAGLGGPLFGGMEGRIAKAVFAVELACHMRLAHERPLRAGVDGVVRPQQMHHAPRVRERVAQQAVARHGGQADDLQLRQRMRQHDGDGIVRTGVAVDPDGNLFRCHAFASP